MTASHFYYIGFQLTRDIDRALNLVSTKTLNDTYLIRQIINECVILASDMRSKRHKAYYLHQRERTIDGVVAQCCRF